MHLHLSMQVQFLIPIFIKLYLMAKLFLNTRFLCLQPEHEKMFQALITNNGLHHENQGNHRDLERRDRQRRGAQGKSAGAGPVRSCRHDLRHCNHTVVRFGRYCGRQGATVARPPEVVEHFRFHRSGGRKKLQRQSQPRQNRRQVSQCKSASRLWTGRQGQEPER